jgi:hypothetical protein
VYLLHLLYTKRAILSNGLLRGHLGGHAPSGPATRKPNRGRTASLDPSIRCYAAILRQAQDSAQDALGAAQDESGQGLWSSSRIILAPLTCQRGRSRLGQALIRLIPWVHVISQRLLQLKRLAASNTQSDRVS